MKYKVSSVKDLQKVPAPDSKQQNMKNAWNVPAPQQATTQPPYAQAAKQVPPNQPSIRTTSPTTTTTTPNAPLTYNEAPKEAQQEHVQAAPKQAPTIQVLLPFSFDLSLIVHRRKKSLTLCFNLNSPHVNKISFVLLVYLLQRFCIAIT